MSEKSEEISCRHIWTDEWWDPKDLHIKRECYKCSLLQEMSPERQHEKKDESYLTNLAWEQSQNSKRI